MKQLVYLLGFVTLLYSCYDDKGNYDYREPNLVEIVIPQGKNISDILMGKPYRIAPEFVFSDPLHTAGFEYYWVFRGDTIGRQPELNHVFNSPEKSVPLYLYAKDPGTGYQSVSVMTVTVTSEYAKGWVLLGEGSNRQSVIGFVRPLKETETEPRRFEATADVYAELFPGKLVGRKPTGLQITYTQWPLYSSQILVMQEEECLKLNGFAYSVDTLLKDEFLDSEWPENFMPVQAHYAYLMDFLLDGDGDLYFRSIPSVQAGSLWSTFYPCRYVSFPLKFQGEKMQVRRGAGLPDIYLVYERNTNRSRNRLVAICTNDFNLGGMFLFEENHSNFQNLKDFGEYDLLYHGRVYGVSDKNLVMILKKGSEYLLQTCNAAWTGGIYENTGRCTHPERIVFPGSHLISEHTLFFSPRKALLFFAENDKLYYYDYAAGTVKSLFDFAGRKVTAMDTNPQVSELGVGLDNGEFVLFDISNEQIASSVVKFRTTGIGSRIVDVRYKYEDGVNWNRNTAD